MFKNILFIIGVAWVISACSLTSAGSSIPLEAVTMTPEEISADTSLVEIAPSLTPAPTSTPIEIAQNDIPVAAPSNCVPNTDLPVYSVRNGDTLSGIASGQGVTVQELVRLNCLDNSNLITAGQQLYVPNPLTTSNVNQQENDVPANIELQSVPIAESNNAASIDVANIPLHPATYHGSIIPSSWIANREHASINAYIVEENAPITFTWSYFPTKLGITEVGLVIRPNNDVGGYTLIGTDTNLLDGVSVSWTMPANAQIDVFAVGKIPGQQELIVSESIRLGARNSNVPLQERVQGTTSISPTLIFNSPGDVVIDPDGVPITIEWIGVTSGYGYHLIDQVSFYYQDANGNTTFIGADTNDSDGISVTWESLPTIAGVVYAEGEFLQIGQTISQVMLTMPNINIDVEIDSCMFFGYGIGAPHPVYPSPDQSTTPIAEIREIDRYPVIEQGELFHHIDLGDQSGWVESGRGGLVGNC